MRLSTAVAVDLARTQVRVGANSCFPVGCVLSFDGEPCTDYLCQNSAEVGFQRNQL